MISKQKGPLKAALSILFAITVLPITSPASAATLEISAEDVFRETRYNPPPFFTQGDNFLASATVTDLDTGQPAAGASVAVTNSSTGEIFGMDGCSFNCDVSAFISYSDARALGDWTFTASLDGNTVSAVFPALGTGPGNGPMPGVIGLQIQDNDLTPTFSWTNPPEVENGTANDGNVGRFRIRIQDLDGSLVYDQRLTSGVLDTTSFEIPSGILTEPGRYVGQVLVEGFNPFIRSRTFEIFEVSLCSIELSQSTYVDGETVIADVIRISNPTASAIATEIKIWLGVPGAPPIAIANLGANGRLVLNPGFDSDSGPQRLFDVNASNPRGDYELSCRVLNPVTGELLYEDLNSFEIAAGTSFDMTQRTATSVITFSECPNDPLGWDYSFSATEMTLVGSDGWDEPVCTTDPETTVVVDMTSIAPDFDIPFNCSAYPVCNSADFNKTIVGVDEDNRQFTSTYSFDELTNQITYVKAVAGTTFTEVITIQ